MRLKTDGLEIEYSPAEREIFAFLSVGRKNAVNSRELVETRYADAEVPYHALSIIRSALSGLSRKIEINKEPFRLEKSNRNGPHPISYWLEKK